MSINLFENYFLRHNFFSKWYQPSGQNRQKTVCRSAVFLNSALKIQCHVVSTLLQTAFSAIFPTGKHVYYYF